MGTQVADAPRREASSTRLRRQLANSRVDTLLKQKRVKIAEKKDPEQPSPSEEPVPQRPSPTKGSPVSSRDSSRERQLEQFEGARDLQGICLKRNVSIDAPYESACVRDEFCLLADSGQEAAPSGRTPS